MNQSQTVQGRRMRFLEKTQALKMRGMTMEEKENRWKGKKKREERNRTKV
jgi:hypothetical protein